jgi:hypothetical protein
MKHCLLIPRKAPAVRRVATVLSVHNMSLQILVKTGKALYVNPALSLRPGKTSSQHAGQGAAVGSGKIVSEPQLFPRQN